MPSCLWVQLIHITHEGCVWQDAMEEKHYPLSTARPKSLDKADCDLSLVHISERPPLDRNTMAVDSFS